MQPSALISVQSLHQYISDPTSPICIIDARFNLSMPEQGQQLYTQGHIPSAIFLDLDKDMCGKKTGKNGRHPLPDREKLAKCLREKGINQDTLIIVYDEADSMFAAHVWWLMLWLGHQQVQVLDGGLAAWVGAGHPLCTQVSDAFIPGNIQVQSPLVPTVNVAYILDHLQSPQMQVIDARAAERFRGDIEPLDPAAGHIPGAINHPFIQNLNSHKRFKPPEQLRQEWLQLIGQTPVSTIVHQCGSGVSACHNILAMVHAGFGITTIYPGSWSEWCADPSRPLQKG